MTRAGRRNALALPTAGDERARLFAGLVELYPGFDEYRRTHDARKAARRAPAAPGLDSGRARNDPDGGDARRVHALPEIEAAIRRSWALDTRQTNDGRPATRPADSATSRLWWFTALFGGAELLVVEVTRNGEPVEMHMRAASRRGGDRPDS